MKNITAMNLTEKDKKDLAQFKKARIEELQESKSWIENGKKDAIWHWDGVEYQQKRLESSYDYFINYYNTPEERTEENIIRFCGREIVDLWDGYKDDSIDNRQNHCAALYHYMKNKLGV